MRRVAKRDIVEIAIKQGLQAVGFVVWEVSSKGAPDLIAFHDNFGLFLIECKSKGGKLTRDQQTFHKLFEDCQRVIIGRDIDQILAAMGVTK